MNNGNGETRKTVRELTKEDIKKRKLPIQINGLVITKIEKDEAVTSEDFEEVFDTNVSPN